MGGTIVTSKESKILLLTTPKNTARARTFCYWSLPLLFTLFFVRWIFVKHDLQAFSDLPVELSFVAMVCLVAASGPHLALTRMLADLDFSQQNETPFHHSKWHLTCISIATFFCCACAMFFVSSDDFDLQHSHRLLYALGLFLFMVLLPCAEWLEAPSNRVLNLTLIVLLLVLSYFLHCVVLFWPLFFLVSVVAIFFRRFPKTIPTPFGSKSHQLLLMAIGPLLMAGAALSFKSLFTGPLHTTETIRLWALWMLLNATLLFFFVSNVRSERRLSPHYNNIYSLLSGINSTPNVHSFSKETLSNVVFKECFNTHLVLSLACLLCSLAIPYLSLGVLRYDVILFISTLKIAFVFSNCFVAIQFLRMNALGWLLAFSIFAFAYQSFAFFFSISPDLKIVFELSGLIVSFYLGLFVIQYRAKHIFFYALH